MSGPPLKRLLESSKLSYNSTQIPLLPLACDITFMGLAVFRRLVVPGGGAGAICCYTWRQAGLALETRRHIFIVSLAAGSISLSGNRNWKPA
jgi:hypothetical protein